MRRQIIQSGVDTRELFRIETCEDGYFAIRDANPRFALWGETILQAVHVAVRALESHAPNLHPSPKDSTP